MSLHASRLQRGRGEPERVELWLDRHLARAFLAMERFHIGGEPDGGFKGCTLPAAEQGLSTAGHVPESLELDQLARAGAALPPGHRVAFWLAIMERRRYGDIADILGRGREVVARWVREAYRFVQGALVVDRPVSARRGGRG